MGIFTGRALRRCVERGAEQTSLAGMIGKFSKLAQGHLQTHVAGNQVDPIFLAEVAAACGASEDLQAEIRGANTARHVQELTMAAGLDAFFPRIAEMVVDQCWAHASGKLAVDALLFDFDGRLLGRAHRPGERPNG
jgi:cobalt-precorrin-5B (C1)-methyltransferase